MIQIMVITWTQMGAVHIVWDYVIWISIVKELNVGSTIVAGGKMENVKNHKNIR